MAPRVIGTRRNPSELREAFRRCLQQPEMIVAPGVFDGMSAIVAANAGFPAVYVSGGAVSRAAGLPDLGVLTFSEMRERICEVVESVNIPVIADADAGYGGTFNVMRTVRDLEQSGVAALHIEDQVSPKRCGHYESKAVVSTSDMCARLAAALRARGDGNLVIIARTDALATEGLDAAIRRADAYRKAGADMLFVEAVRSREEVERVASDVPGPLVINMFAGGVTPLLSSEVVARYGYKVMIVPSDLQRASLYAMQEAARVLRSEGSTATMSDRMTPFVERDHLVGLEEFLEIESAIKEGPVAGTESVSLDGG